MPAQPVHNAAFSASVIWRNSAYDEFRHFFDRVAEFESVPLGIRNGMTCYRDA
jgi:hypothetical protein